MKTTAGSRLADLPQVARLGGQVRRDISVVSSVLPFKVNNYVIDKLIDWSAVPDDPIFRLTFPHRDMLPSDMYSEVESLVARGTGRAALRTAVEPLRKELNPHPGEQLAKNIPSDGNGPVFGLEHKYRETVLIFPSHGQTCHAYCGYCFRWAQFVGVPDLKQQVDEPGRISEYLRSHTEVSDVLFTGGDPMIMSTEVLRRWVAPLFEPGFEHIRNIRFGSKALSYWPYRFTNDPDADDLLRLFDQIVRVQAPLVRHVNNSPEAWADLWRTSVRLGAVPYYMFVERDTGARGYFGVSLTDAVRIYRDAVSLRLLVLLPRLRSAGWSGRLRGLYDGAADVDGTRSRGGVGDDG